MVPLIQLNNIAANLLDSARNTVAVQRADGIEGFEHHQVERAGHDFILGLRHLVAATLNCT